MPTIVFYNQYNVDAVIYAAVMKKQRLPENIVFKQFTSNYAGEYEEAFFIGCFPSEEQQKYISSNNIPCNVLHLSTTTARDMQFEGLRHHTLLKFLIEEVENGSISDPEFINRAYPLIQALSLFNTHSQKMTIDDLAKHNWFAGLNNLTLIYANWKRATRSLLTKEKFELVSTVTEKDLDEFKEYIQMVKARLSDDTKIVPVIVNAKRQFKVTGIKKLLKYFTDSRAFDNVERVPFINTNVNDAPWYGRFLSRTYQFGILYEVVGNKIIIVPWSKNGDFIPDFTETIQRQINKDYQVVFANG